MMRVLTSGTGFVTLLVTVLMLALWNPAIGAKGNILHPEYLSEVLIVIIFLIQGIRINISRLSVILRKPFVSLALQAGIIMLPILWLNLAWVSGVLSEDLYGALFFYRYFTNDNIQLRGLFDECKRKCRLCFGSCYII